MDESLTKPLYSQPNPSFTEDLRRYFFHERSEEHRRFYESVVKVFEIALLAGALQAVGHHSASKYLTYSGYFVQLIGALYIWSFFEGPFRRAKRRPYFKMLAGAFFAIALSYGAGVGFANAIKVFVDDQIKPTVACPGAKPATSANLDHR